MKIEIDLKNFPEYTYPRQAVLVTVIDVKPNILTASWHSPISRLPPLYGVSVHPKRFSHDIILKSKEFVVNHAPFKIVEQVHYCGRRSGREVDKFKETGLTAVKAKKVKPPLIKECYAHFECKLFDSFKLGDHTWIVGEVVAASVDKEYFDVVNKKRFDLKPALWLGAETYTDGVEKRKF